MSEAITNKLTSRKFWLAVAAFCASVGASVAGFADDNTTIAGIGLFCSIFSAAVYAAAESYVDGKSLSSKTEAVVTTTNVNANTTSAQTVERLIAKDTQSDTNIKIGGTE